MRNVLDYVLRNIGHRACGGHINNGGLSANLNHLGRRTNFQCYINGRKVTDFQRQAASLDTLESFCRHFDGILPGGKFENR